MGSAEAQRTALAHVGTGTSCDPVRAEARSNRHNENVTRLTACGIALLVLASACRSPETMSFPPPSVRLETVQNAPVADASLFVATIRSRQSVDIRPQVSGHITEIFVKAGDEVEAGDPILQIDPARQQAIVAEAEAALHLAEANLQRSQSSVQRLRATREARRAELEYARQERERSADLYESKVLSKQELDQRLAELRSARAGQDAANAEISVQRADVKGSAEAVRRARATLERTRVQLAYHRVVAPIQGTIGDIPVRVGDRVDPTVLLTTLDRLEALEAYISVPLERAADVRLGLPVQLVDSRGDVIDEGEVTFVSPQIDPNTQLVLIKTVVDPRNSDLTIGQYARARVIWSMHDGPVVPLESIVRVNGKPFVFRAVTGEDGSQTVEQVPVELGASEDGTAAILSGIVEGDSIVREGVQRLIHGTPIVPLDPPEEAEPGDE